MTKVQNDRSAKVQHDIPVIVQCLVAEVLMHMYASLVQPCRNMLLVQQLLMTILSHMCVVACP